MEDARAQPSMCTIDLAAHAASIRESINFYSSPNSTMASRVSSIETNAIFKLIYSSSPRGYESSTFYDC